MNNKDSLRIFIYEDFILVTNRSGKIKEFPRCSITNVKSFVMEMAKTGHLDDLLM